MVEVWNHTLLIGFYHSGNKTYLLISNTSLHWKQRIHKHTICCHVT